MRGDPSLKTGMWADGSRWGAALCAGSGLDAWGCKATRMGGGGGGMCVTPVGNDICSSLYQCCSTAVAAMAMPGDLQAPCGFPNSLNKRLLSRHARKAAGLYCDTVQDACKQRELPKGVTCKVWSSQGKGVEEHLYFCNRPTVFCRELPLSKAAGMGSLCNTLRSNRTSVLCLSISAHLPKQFPSAFLHGSNQLPH